MIALLLTIFFPVLMGSGFALLSYVLAIFQPQRIGLVMARYGGHFYLGFLTIPLVAVLIQGVIDDSFAAMWLRRPHIGGVASWLASILGVVLAVIAGVFLYYNELYLSMVMKRVMSGASAKVNMLVDGGSQVARTQHRGFGPYMLLSIGISLAEEMIWRGFLTYYLESRLGVPLAAALVIGAVLFGLNHTYFGLRNVLLKTIDGLVWGVLMIVTSSVLVPILSHITFQYFVWQRLARQQMHEMKA